MRLHEIAPAPGSSKKAIRVGRGRAGRRGKTAGRGQKGAKARGQIPAAYEGGQMPLHMRLPKLPGFNNWGRVEYTVINLDGLDQFAANDIVDAEALRSRGLVRKKGLVKILGRGELSKPLTVKAHAFSGTAVTKIEAAGGSTEVVGPANQ